MAEVVVSTTTGSLILYADGLDSMTDALISFIVWFGISMIQKPKARLFPYAYGKIESFAAFIAAVIVVALGIFIAYHAYEKIIHPTDVINPEITMITLLTTGAISLHRAFRGRGIAKKHKLFHLIWIQELDKGWFCIFYWICKCVGWKFWYTTYRRSSGFDNCRLHLLYGICCTKRIYTNFARCYQQSTFEQKDTGTHTRKVSYEFRRDSYKAIGGIPLLHT